MEHIVDIPDNIETIYNVFGKDWIMGLPVREEIIRCRDCKYSTDEYNISVCDTTLCDDGKLNCLYFADWDYYNDHPGHCFVEPDGFCAWSERRDS